MASLFAEYESIIEGLEDLAVSIERVNNASDRAELTLKLMRLQETLREYMK